MASSNQLKGYLKKEVQTALGMTVDSPEFDKIMGAFAKAIDTYLKNDLKVDIDVESKGHLDITPAFTTIDPNVQLTYDLETRTTTKGNLV